MGSHWGTSKRIELEVKTATSPSWQKSKNEEQQGRQNKITKEGEEH